MLAVKDGHCRLCWQQARRQSQLAGGLPRGAVSVLQAGTLRFHQLFFDRMKGRRAGGRPVGTGRRGAPRKPPPAPASCPAVRWLQPRLFEAGKDFTRFDEDNNAGLQNPWLIWAIYLACRRSEARGWKRGMRLDVRRALIIVLSGHQRKRKFVKRRGEIFLVVRGDGRGLGFLLRVMPVCVRWRAVRSRRGMR